MKVIGKSSTLRLAAALAAIIGFGAAARPDAAYGADEANSLAAGTTAGIFAGAVLLALVCYAVWLLVRPLVKARDRSIVQAGLFLTAILLVKCIALVWLHGFAVDVGTYQAWALKINAVGPARMYESGYFLDYPPGYLYLLWAAGWLARMIGAAGGEPLRMMVELPPLLGDFALAFAIFVFVRRRGRPLAAWAAMLLVALNPALIFDSLVWGQTDSVLALALFLSIAMMLQSEFEIGWALAALAVLIKPQALTLLPVLGLWTLLRMEPGRWWRALLASAATLVIGAAPFQIGHSWRWLPGLYLSTAAYYHETSVNAFNLVALIGGIRQPDTGEFLGLSYLAIGMGLLVPLYAFVALVLWRNPNRRNLFFASFVALFGFFMFAPRMHERYLYCAIVFALPLALTEPAMLGLFSMVTLTCLLNLAYVLHILRTTVFMDARDPIATAAELINLFALAVAVGYGWIRVGIYDRAAPQDVNETVEERTDVPSARLEAGESWLLGMLARTGRWIAIGPASSEFMTPLAWTRLDTIVIAVLLAVAGILRFWNLDHPRELVFDEVHFVGQARHYLRAETFLDPHPPLAKLITALGIILFGDHPWAWRIGVATIGTMLVGVTYLLGRRMFHSRMAAGLSATFVLSDGFFLVDSRTAVIDMVYLTFAAISYLLLFRFMQTVDLRDRRRILVFMGAALGLCLGSKLYVPGITFMIVAGFVVFTLARPGPGSSELRIQQIAGATMILGALSGFFYLACFLPHYFLGWWGGIADLFHYYADVMWYEKSVSTVTHPYASPWWSWPLMLRPVAYWQNFPDKGDVATIWGAGNPILWWGVIPAITITAVRAIEHPNVSRTFMVIAYLSYFVIWIPITRILFLYHYMPSVYIGYLALGYVIADLYDGKCELWESFAILVALIPALALGLGHMAYVYKFEDSPLRLSLRQRELAGAILLLGYIAALMRPRSLANVTAIAAISAAIGLLLLIPPLFAGIPAVVFLVLVYMALLRTPLHVDRFVAAVFLVCAGGVFIYFLPVWLGIPVTRLGYYARMWFEGPGIRNWI